MKTAISLFAGAGLSSLGYERAGFQVRAAIEFDPIIADSYRANHKSTTMLVGDVAKVTGKRLLEAAEVKEGELDLLDASPPCQNWSLMGKRRFDDLIYEPLRQAKEIRPRAFVLENVEGLALGEAAPVAHSLLSNLRELGYQADARLLGCCWFGVPQARVRFYLIGIRADCWNGSDFYPMPDKKPTPVSAVLGRPKGKTPHGRFARMIELKPDEPAPTIIASDGHHLWFGAKQLDVADQMLIQGIPPGYVIKGSKVKRQEQVGNAVPPEMARRVGVGILTAMKGDEIECPACRAIWIRLSGNASKAVIEAWLGDNCPHGCENHQEVIERPDFVIRRNDSAALGSVIHGIG